MINQVTLTPEEFRTAAFHAERAALGGTSQVRGADRGEALGQDQLAGQLGQLALHKFWYGDITRYVVGRYQQNKNPWQGDGGEDIPGANIDVKTSVMRRSQDPLSYNLLVRPRERHAGWVYVLALVPPDVTPEQCTVTLVGWYADVDLPETPAESGPFAGAYAVPAKVLYDLPPIMYFYTR